jgi:uncharacterized protein (DUF111 family)
MKKTHENISKRRDFKGRHRDQMEMLGDRVNLLGGADRVLMIMYMQNGNSFRQIARVRGISETSVARRVQRIIRRLANSEYVRCTKSAERLTADQMAMAREFFLLGQSMGRIAARRCSSVHHVRKALEDIRDLASAAGLRARRLSTVTSAYDMRNTR